MRGRERWSTSRGASRGDEEREQEEREEKREEREKEREGCGLGGGEERGGGKRNGGKAPREGNASRHRMRSTKPRRAGSGRVREGPPFPPSRPPPPFPPPPPPPPAPTATPAQPKPTLAFISPFRPNLHAVEGIASTNRARLAKKGGRPLPPPWR